MEIQKMDATKDESQVQRKRTLASYSDIILTEEETQEALRIGRKEKYHKLKEQEWRESLRREHKPIEVTKDQYREWLLVNNAEFKPELLSIGDYNIFERILEYFMSEQTKGLMLRGGVGCGKTTLMKLFMRNPKRSYAFRTCRDISEMFTRKENGGYDAIRQFYSNSQGQRDTWGNDEYGYCFDDLGEEKNKRYFGNEENVMEAILLSRYEKKELWSKTHITTNLTAEQIENIYGSRVRSRMREMFEVIDFTGITDLRK